DLFDASGGAGDDGRAAGHSFKVDDAKGLVDRWATEDAAIAVELDGLLFGDHLLDPDDARVVDAGLGDLLTELGGDFGGVGRTGAEHELDIGRKVADGVDEMRDALLASDAADKEDVGHGEIDAVIGEGFGLGGLLIFGKVDAVVDDVDAAGVDVGVGAEDICPRALRDGDDRVGIEDGGAFHPGTHGVAAAELLGLPSAKRLQRVGGEDKGNAVELFGEEAGHRDIPGVSVDDIDAVESLDLGEVEAEGFERALEFALGTVGDLGPGFGAADVEVPVVGMLRSPAMHFHFDLAGEFAAQIIHVNSGAPIDQWGIFPRE